MHQFFPGVFFNFETVRILGMARYGGADVAEVLEAVGKIKHNDPESWHEAWEEQAEKAQAFAKDARASGNRDAARRALLRAANYTRASGYMFTGEGSLSPDPRTLPISESASSIFREATRLFDNPVQPLQIPYDGQTLEGYLYLPSQASRVAGKIPILIANNGADSIQEEIYFIHPAAGPQLGYAVVTFNGPGQGLALHRDGLRMRPDWEVVTGAVLNHLESLSVAQPEVGLDLERIAVAGASLGGYFALRGATDSRIKAVVAIDPVYDLWDFAMKHVNQTFLSAWGNGWISDGVVDSIVGTMMRLVFQSRWELTLMGNLYGLRLPSQIMRTMKKYTLRSATGNKGTADSYLDGVRCPALVTGAGKSLYLDVDDHTSRVYNGLTHQQPGAKQLWIATSPSEGGLQAKIGAVELCNQRVFHFLDQQFGIHRPGL
ncbi:hypothetical protein AJ80_05107 [Polytolypa hystricis UAMH7299]|uniref:AB hydrolase-1 domain-containing protein n=1 Tax=Polytolypa hystricis (strain UAMH7299) TaxID=1447883 RepID=A0A2B7Y7D4_POLH7|nr:hypothetical protein AJ80_05107 [Polytolypa hystricis UAMH7299]